MTIETILQDAGRTDVYAVRYSGDGTKILATADNSLLTTSAANWTACAIACADTACPKHYVPTSAPGDEPAGTYRIVFYAQAGGSPSPSADDPANVLQNANVRVTSGAQSEVRQTNASGVVVFNLDNGSYTLAITKAGYSFGGTTLAVSGATTATCAMTTVTVSPPALPSQSRGTLRLLTSQGAARPTTKVYLRLTAVPSTPGFGYDSTTKLEFTSDSNGDIQNLDLIQGAKYQASLDSSMRRPVPVEVPNTATFTVPVIFS